VTPRRCAAAAASIRLSTPSFGPAREPGTANTRIGWLLVREAARTEPGDMTTTTNSLGGRVRQPVPDAGLGPGAGGVRTRAGGDVRLAGGGDGARGGRGDSAGPHGGGRRCDAGGQAGCDGGRPVR